MRTLLGRAPATRHTRTVADIRPTSTPTLLFHQHPCIFSINYFVVKLMCLLSSAGPDDRHHNAHCLVPSSIDPR